MIGGCYSPTNFDSHIPANVLGGIKRAKQAKRDSQGKFLAAGQEYRDPDPLHGVSGGLKRAKAKRDSRGRFIKVKANEI